MTWARDLFGEIHAVESHSAEPTRVVIGEAPISERVRWRTMAQIDPTRLLFRDATDLLINDGPTEMMPLWAYVDRTGDLTCASCVPDQPIPD